MVFANIKKIDLLTEVVVAKSKTSQYEEEVAHFGRSRCEKLSVHLTYWIT